MKPASIRKFDLFYWAGVGVGLLGAALTWDQNVALVDRELDTAGFAMEGMGSTAIVLSIGIGLLINVALWALVSILRIEFVKWIILLLSVWGAISLMQGVVAAPAVSVATGILSTILTFAALYFLFRPDAKEWFAQKRDAD